ncbi:hypothetical protein [Oceanobacillus massiliensis]|uniref:hypothetical protein n=1 Tax=Oceanobacillus massiliensis TaxID=1465765 RepID=UPI000288CE2D|nr:hypothetical protein [Oceanobacillus massiliensis]
MKPNILKLLQLIPEGILYYFFLVPFFALNNVNYPLWSYLFIIIITLLLFEAGTNITSSYAVYVPILLFYFAVTYFWLDYPILIAVLLFAYLFWRDWVFEMKGSDNNQLPILILTALFIFIEVIFFYDTHLVWMGVAQVIFVIIGYWVRLVLSAPESNRSQKTSIFFILLFLSGGIILYAIYPIISGAIDIIFTIIGIIFKNAVLGLANLLSWMGVDFSQLNMADEDNYNQMINNIKEDISNLRGLNEAPAEVQDNKSASNGWKYFGLFVGLFVMSVLLYRKRRKSARTSSNWEHWNDSDVQVTALDLNQPIGEGNSRASNDRQPEHLIRKYVLEFEKEANQNGYGRKKYETIEEWFIRLKLEPDDLELYQKVRYGNQELTNEEYERFYDVLQNLKNQLKSK